jgi:hypothetical protein
VSLHPHPVTEDGTTREGTRRIDQNESRSGALGPVVRDEFVDESALPGAGGPRDPDDMSARPKLGKAVDQIGSRSVDDLSDQTAQR